MKEKEFFSQIQEMLQSKLGKDAQIKLHEVRKNNNVMYQGLIIHRKDSNVSPTIYMDAFYKMYEEGESLENIVERILQVYQKGGGKNPIDMEFFKDFDRIKDRIACRLINAERNKELLKDIPHIMFLDLAICFYYAFYNEELGEGIIMIHNNHMEMWNTNHEELMKLAMENTKTLFPPTFITLDAILHGICDGVEDRWLGKKSFYILTNKQKCQGAVNIMFPEILEQAAEKLQGNFYVLPSSIHEVILFKEEGAESGKGLHEMIVEANSTQVLEEDILSDYPYYYDNSTKKLTQIREI